MKRFRPFSLFRDLSGRSNLDLRHLLLRQVDASLSGARLARQAAASELPSGAARTDMAATEHDGDRAREHLVTILAQTLVTPFDREDIFRVSRSIDDVLDNLRDFVRELDLFRTPGELFVPVIDAVIDGLELLHAALTGTAGRARDMQRQTLAAKKACNGVRRSYELQLVRLLDGKVSAEMLRRRELLRRLDVVGLRLGEAVDALADAAIKRTL